MICQSILSKDFEANGRKKNDFLICFVSPKCKPCIAARLLVRFHGDSLFTTVESGYLHSQLAKLFYAIKQNMRLSKISIKNKQIWDLQLLCNKTYYAIIRYAINWICLYFLPLLLCLLAYSRLGVATADICIFMAWHLFYGWMPFLPPTLYSEGKLGHLSST